MLSFIFSLFWLGLILLGASVVVDTWRTTSLHWTYKVALTFMITSVDMLLMRFIWFLILEV